MAEALFTFEKTHSAEDSFEKESWEKFVSKTNELNFRDINFGAMLPGAGSKIDGNLLVTGTVTVDKLNVSQLSAINANLGTITAGTISGITITGGTIQTAASGLRLVMSGSNSSYEFRNGSVLLAELKSQTVPFSGTSGAAIRHGTGTVLIEVSGAGEGLGGRQVLLTNSAGTVYVGLLDTDDGDFYIAMGGLPTSAPGGSGRIWADSGTLKIT